MKRQQESGQGMVLYWAHQRVITILRKKIFKYIKMVDFGNLNKDFGVGLKLDNFTLHRNQEQMSQESNPRTFDNEGILAQTFPGNKVSSPINYTLVLLL